MDQNKINGFREPQIFQLYDFLVAYEDSGIRKYKSTKKMLEEHPELFELNEQIKYVECKKSDAIEMKDIDFKQFHNKIYFTKCKGNNLLSFLAHLRNTIAHGCAVEHNGNVLITNFANPIYRPIDFSARGCIDFSVIRNFTDILKKIEL